MNHRRIGRFTSSEIVALIGLGSRDMTDEELKAHKAAFPKSKKTKIEHGFSDAAWTYIEEKNMERRLGVSLDDEGFARALVWGRHLEQFAFDFTTTSYQLVSDETIVHPMFDTWCGTPDVFKDDTVGDIKCPLTKKSFCQLVDPIYDGLTGIEVMNAIRKGYISRSGVPRKGHKDGEKFYWQLVSNACLTSKEYAELIVFMPYESQIQEIRESAQNGQSDHYWIAMAKDGELPFLPERGFYSNINTIRFRVPDEDKKLLQSRVESASKFLVSDQIDILIAEHDKDVNATIIQKGK